jgi:ribosome-binding protein aMBF1 (putative translation factor)
MEQITRERLEAAGWSVGSADEFAGLSPEESALLDLKESVGRAVRELRTDRGLTQSQLAATMRSTQSRVAKLEQGDPRVSIDFAVRAMLAMTVRRDDLARAILGGPIDRASVRRRPVAAPRA